ncbi:MAG: hypothetical protein J6Y90_03215, partial [Lachnospiraceae bacterium]|nr:hypothetical protein [Lachnospiraceae bacterium]
METLNEKAARNAKIAGVLKIIILIVLFILFIFPFVLVIINVFKVKADITSDPLALVGSRGFTFQNFPSLIFIHEEQVIAAVSSELSGIFHEV